MKRVFFFFAIILLTSTKCFAACDITVDGYQYCDFDISEYSGISSVPAISSAGKARIYFDTAAGKLKCSENGASYADCVSSGGGASTSATYLTKTAESGLSAEFSLGTLTTGLLLNTVSAGTGTPSAYAGTSCTNQFPRSLNASGVATCASVAMGTDVTGVLPVANGGTNASSAGITAFNNITGLSAAGTTGTTSTNLVFSTSPTFVTPTLGAASATSVACTNGINIGSTLTYTAGTTTSAVLNVTPNSLTTGATFNGSSSSNSYTGVGLLKVTYSGTNSGRGVLVNMSDSSASGEAVRITQAGTGLALIVEDQSSDGSPFVIDSSGKVGVGTSTPGKALDVVGEIRNDNKITSTVSTNIGWTVVDGTDNTACDSICTSGAVYGWNVVAGNVTGIPLNPNDATADVCICAGAS